MNVFSDMCRPMSVPNIYLQMIEDKSIIIVEVMAERTVLLSCKRRIGERVLHSCSRNNQAC